MTPEHPTVRDPRPAPPSAPAGSTRALLFGGFLLAAIIAGQGLYASRLNLLFYQHFGPFYDSAAYTNQLANIMYATRNLGSWAVVKSLFGESTLILPWLEATVLAHFLPPTRTLGVWMQEIWMYALGASLFVYLFRYRKAGFTASICLVLPFLSFSQVYYFNGGIPDFRMDLSLYALLALTATWYLVTYETEAFWPWLVTGVAALLCVLNRATSPAYMAFVFGPPYALRLLTSAKPDRMRVARHSLWVGVPVIAISGLYLWSNWSYIHYYYFVWGPDPTAKLPFREGLKHFEFAFVNAGRLTVYACMSLGLVTILRRTLGAIRHGGWKQLALSVDVKTAWFGIAPPLLLALNGAGFNPFVAMPAVFGGLLFLMAPLRGPLLELKANSAAHLACALIVAACLVNAAFGVDSHGRPEGTNSNMAALKAAVNLMLQDARARGLKKVQYATAQDAWFEAILLKNVLYYDFHGIDDDGGVLLPQGVVFRCDYHPRFSASAELNWTKELPGTTDEEKVDYLANLANQKVDYFFLPDDATIHNLETYFKNNYINNKVRLIKKRVLETGDWKQVGPPLVADQFETVLLYVNQARGGKPSPTTTETRP